MELAIRSLEEACMYRSNENVYHIQIDSADKGDSFRFENLNRGGNFIHRIYHFDDVTPSSGNGLLFDERIAENIMDDFITGAGRSKILLVNCFAGLSRSPAVGIALNDIFSLGYNSDELKERYAMFNQWVYKIMLETAGFSKTEWSDEMWEPARVAV